VSGSTWPIIELELAVIAFYIFMKCGEDPMTFARVIERKHEKTKFYDDSRAVTQECLGQFGRQSNLT